MMMAFMPSYVVYSSSLCLILVVIFGSQTHPVDSNRFQNGLMLGYILNMKGGGGGGGGQSQCTQKWEFGTHPEGLGWKLKECPENLVVQVFKKTYHLDKYQAKAAVTNAKAEKKAVTLLGKALQKVPCPFKSHE